jgi:hypothetical protein
MPSYQGFASTAQINVAVTVDPDSVTAATVGAQSVTVPGAQPGMWFVVSAPSLEANLAIGGAECTTAGTVVVRIVNPTAGNINPASQVFYILGL